MNSGRLTCRIPFLFWIISPRVITNLGYTIGINEAACYYGIGTKKLRQIIADNPSGDFFLEIGRHVLIKRRQFEAYLDNASAL